MVKAVGMTDYRFVIIIISQRWTIANQFERTNRNIKMFVHTTCMPMSYYPCIYMYVSSESPSSERNVQ